jgi:hypothetical protein
MGRHSRKEQAQIDARHERYVVAGLPETDQPYDFAQIEHRMASKAISAAEIYRALGRLCDRGILRKQGGRWLRLASVEGIGPPRRRDEEKYSLLQLGAQARDVLDSLLNHDDMTAAEVADDIGAAEWKARRILSLLGRHGLAAHPPRLRPGRIAGGGSTAALWSATEAGVLSVAELWTITDVGARELQRRVAQGYLPGVQKRQAVGDAA